MREAKLATNIRGEGGDRYMDLKDLSSYSALSVRTLRHYLSIPVDPIPCFQLEKKILVKKSEFDFWILRRKRKTPDLTGLVDEILNDFILDK